MKLRSVSWPSILVFLVCFVPLCYVGILLWGSSIEGATELLLELDRDLKARASILNAMLARQTVAEWQRGLENSWFRMGMSKTGMSVREKMEMLHGHPDVLATFAFDSRSQKGIISPKNGPSFELQFKTCSIPRFNDPEKTRGLLEQALAGWEPSSPATTAAPPAIRSMTLGDSDEVWAYGWRDVKSRGKKHAIYVGQIVHKEGRIENIGLTGFVLDQQAAYRKILDNVPFVYPDHVVEILDSESGATLNFVRGEKIWPPGFDPKSVGCSYLAETMDLTPPLNRFLLKIHVSSEIVGPIRHLARSVKTRLILLFVSLAIFGLLAFYIRMRLFDARVRLQNDWIDFLSHQTQTPIHSLGVLAEILLGGSKESRMSELFHTELNRLTATVRSFVRLARQGAAPRGQPKTEIDLADVIREAVDVTGLLYRDRSPRFELEGLEDQKILRADRTAILDMLVNLLDNACKYSPGEPRIEIQVQETPETLLVLVSDRGFGIPAGEEEKVKQLFYRSVSDRTEGLLGTGIGLALVDRIVSDHGGSLVLEQRDGGGTRVRVILPR